VIPSPLRGGFGRLRPELRGVLLALVATVCFACMHIGIRYLSSDLHPFEIAFFRNLFGVLSFMPWFVTGGIVALRTQRIGTHAIRAVVNTVSMLAWFTSLSLLPVADATSLSLVGPVFVTIGAILFFKEQVNPSRWIGMAVAIGGALIIVRPGLQPVSFGAGLVLAATVCVSTSKLIAKSLSRTDSTAAIVAYLTFMMMGFTLVPALFVWQRPSLEHVGLLALIGALGTAGHILFIESYKLADVSLVEPVMLMQMTWAAVMGLFVFAEFPDIWTWIGAAVSVAGTTYMTRRETAKVHHAAEPLPWGA